MPELCRFYGIVIRMYYDDHLPPHFHALYAGHEAVIGIEALALIEGKLPPRAMGLVAEWAALRSFVQTRFDASHHGAQEA
jgi:hypothetical protein